MLNRKQNRATDETLVTSVTAAHASASDAGVAEPRPTDGSRLCPACQLINGHDDSYCTGCGAELPALSEAGIEESSDHDGNQEVEQTLIRSVFPLPIRPTPEVLTPRTVEPTRLRLPHWLALAGVVLVVAAAVGLAVLWRVEVGHTHQLSGKLAITSGKLVTANNQLAASQAQLKATSAISQKRKAVLLRAQAVLASV